MTDIPDRRGGTAGVSSNASAVAVALAVTALGAFVAFDTFTGLAGPSYAEVGPGVFPLIVGAALLLAGGSLLLQSLRAQWRVAWVERDASTAPMRNVLLAAGALTLDVLLFAPLGFIAASAMLFACVSAAFGSRRFPLDALVGIVFAAAIYIIFVHGLGLGVPAGDLWSALWKR
jgi:putative tricarboxylic transport membrane protein